MFDFFKKSVKNSHNAWKNGAKLSGIDINLPFISINISPEESDSHILNITKDQISNQIEQQPLPRQELKFNIVKNASDELVLKNQLMVDYFYNTPISFDGNRPVFEKDSWRKLDGNIQLVANEPLWIIGRFRNISKKVLYQIPIGLKDLPFIDNGVSGYFSGYLNGSEFRMWAKSSISGLVFETMNANDCIHVHCFCRVPQILDTKSKFNFVSYLSNDDKGRKIIEDIIKNSVKAHHENTGWLWKSWIKEEYRSIEGLEKTIELVMLMPLVKKFSQRFFSLYNSEDPDTISNEILPLEPYLTHVFDAREYEDYVDDIVSNIRHSCDTYGELNKDDYSVLSVDVWTKRDWSLRIIIKYPFQPPKYTGQYNLNFYVELMMTNQKELYIYKADSGSTLN